MGSGDDAAVLGGGREFGALLSRMHFYLHVSPAEDVSDLAMQTLVCIWVLQVQFLQAFLDSIVFPIF